MHYATTSAVVMAAFGIGQVVAGPAHLHAHQHAHKGKRSPVPDWTEVDFSNMDVDWDNLGIDWAAAYAAGEASKASAAAAKTSAASVSAALPSTTLIAVTTSAPIVEVAAKVAATSTSSTKAAATSAASSSSDLETAVGSIISDIADLWNGVVGMANDLTEFGSATVTNAKATTNAEGVDMIGNIGSPQGSNMIKVSSRKGYKFTNEFINTSKKSMTIMIWNKAFTNSAGVTEANSGSCFAPTKPALSIALAPGASQIVAFQENTQIGFAQATDKLAASGAFATAWGEVNYLAAGSGYDLSAIMNPSGNNYNMSMSATETDCISDMTQNFWLTDTQPIGSSDGSCYIGSSTATMTTRMGGTV